MNQKSKLIVGKVVDLGDKRVVEAFRPRPHAEVALENQRKLAALIAAAYLYRDEPNGETLARLREAAKAL